MNKRMSDEEVRVLQLSLPEGTRHDKALSALNEEMERARESEAELERQLEAFVVAHAEATASEDYLRAKVHSMGLSLDAKTASEARLLAALKEIEYLASIHGSRLALDIGLLAESAIAAAEGES